MPEHLKKKDGDSTHDTIEKRGEKYVLLSAEGKVLGTHATREEAEAQERAIESAKARSGTADSEGWAYTLDFAPFSKTVATRDSNGFMRVSATVTAPGVYGYVRNGRFRNELKPASEIFSALHMQSVHGAVVTNEHPPNATAVTPDNAADLQKGHSMSMPTSSPAGMELDLVITDGGLIEDIESRRKTGVSLGMRNTFDNTPGIWTAPDGSKHPYEVSQIHMITNHAAIVAEPRVTSAQLHLDSLEQEQQQEEQHMDKATLTIDGADFEVDKNVASIVKAHLGRRDKELEASQAKLKEATDSYDSLTVEKDKLAAERDAAFAERDAANEKVASSDAIDVNALADQRLAFLEKVQSVLSAEKFKSVRSKTETEIMQFTVDSHGIETKEQTEAYVKARFDILVENVGKTNDSTFLRAAVNPIEEPGRAAHRTDINARLKAHSDKQLGRTVN